MNPILKVATALDNLGGRMYSDLNLDSSYLDPSNAQAVEDAINGFCAYAEECLGVLDDPAVRAALDAARKAD